MESKDYDRPPEMALKPGYKYHANFVTEKGAVKVRLFAEERPRPSTTSCSWRGKVTSTGPRSTVS
jgi:hypothetical protein